MFMRCQMTAGPLMMADANDAVQQMRQHQMLALHDSNYQPLNVFPSSADSFYSTAMAPSPAFNGSLPQMTDEG